MQIPKYPHFMIYIRDNKSKPRDFDINFNIVNLANWLKVNYFFWLKHKTFVPNFKYDLVSTDKMEYTWELSPQEDRVRIAEVFLRKDATMVKEFGIEYVEAFTKANLGDYGHVLENDL